MWLPVHGCALPLPLRGAQRCGVRQFGPKPSPLFTKCSTDAQMAWILLNAGPEGVIEFALARCELTHCLEEERHWLRYCKLAAKLQNQLELAAEAMKEIGPMDWQQRRRLLIEREQERRNRSLERSWAKPSIKRVEMAQVQLW